MVFEIAVSIRRLLRQAGVGSPPALDPVAQCRAVIDSALAAGLDGVDFAAVPEVVTPEVIAYARARGLTVGVWVTAQLDVERNWRLFAERGVDFLTTNLPAEIFEVFERQPKR